MRPLALGAVIVALVLAGRARAAEEEWPQHEVRGVACERALTGSGVIVKAFPPRRVLPWGDRRDDVAHWRPVLYRWDGTQWVRWTQPSQWSAYAYVNVQGLSQGTNPGWRNRSSHGQLLFVPYSSLPAGIYTVVHQIQWSSSRRIHDHIAPNSCSTGE
jgi:hypothetical protein